MLQDGDWREVAGFLKDRSTAVSLQLIIQLRRLPKFILKHTRVEFLFAIGI